MCMGPRARSCVGRARVARWARGRASQPGHSPSAPRGVSAAAAAPAGGRGLRVEGTEGAQACVCVCDRAHRVDLLVEEILHDARAALDDGFGELESEHAPQRAGAEARVGKAGSWATLVLVLFVAKLPLARKVC